jgi:WD repeat-containing protein 19
VRVARSISRFPRHVVPILTSTVIECHRAGLRRTALEYATLLMRPEHRGEVSAKYKRKIELMVRKPERDPEEAAEPLSACPFCQLPGADTELQCASCQSLIPFCIASGRRMRLDDWAACPRCQFPANGQSLLRVLAAEARCPLCSEPVALGDVRAAADPAAALAALKY